MHIENKTGKVEVGDIGSDWWSAQWKFERVEPLVETKITSSDSDEAANDWFGYSVSMSIDGNTVVVGASLDDEQGNNSGSAYIYKWNGVSWAETKITPSDGLVSDYDNFGNSVSMSGDGHTVVVGANGDPNQGSDSGSVYIYKWNGVSWAETKITPSDGPVSDYDYFGNSVSTSGDGNMVVVGAFGDHDQNNKSGSAYIYKWDGDSWVETKITPSDGAESDYFGLSVSMSGDGNMVVVGAPQNDDQGNSSGSTYIYKWNDTSWAETKITASDGAESDCFGVSVSTSGDGNTVVVGAFEDGDQGYSSGSAYIYKWNGVSWAETKITASDKTEYDYFGESISMSGNGNIIVVGAYGDDDQGDRSGSVYIYNRLSTPRNAI